MLAIETLQKDYVTTLGFIDKCDDHMFKIKNCALITTSAVIAFSISRDKNLIVKWDHPNSNATILIYNVSGKLLLNKKIIFPISLTPDFHHYQINTTKPE